MDHKLWSSVETVRNFIFIHSRYSGGGVLRDSRPLIQSLKRRQILLTLAGGLCEDHSVLICHIQTLFGIFEQRPSASAGVKS